MKVREIDLQFIAAAAKSSAVDCEMVKVILQAIYKKMGLLEETNPSVYAKLLDTEFPAYIEEKDIVSFLEDKDFDLEILQIGGFLNQKEGKYFFEHLFIYVLEESMRIKNGLPKEYSESSLYVVDCKPRKSLIRKIKERVTSF